MISNLLFIIPYLCLSILWGLVIFARKRVEVIHSHSPAIAGVAGVIIAKILRIPHVYTVHGLVGMKMPWSSISGNPIEYLLEKYVLSRSRVIILVSDDYRPFARFLAPEGRIVTIRNGVDTDAFKPISDLDKRLAIRKALGVEKEDVLLLWVGNFDLEEKVKGVLDTIRAISSLPPDIIGALHLLLVGDGTLQDQVKEMVSQLGLSNRVSFLGHRNDISRIMGVCDVFILASHHEGSPISLLEAMASGLVCIGSNTGGIATIIGEAGFLFEVGDIEMLASLLHKIILVPSEREKIALRARDRCLLELSAEKAASSNLRVLALAIKEKDDILGIRK